jgi:EAL domain-containing protein (putative c-di-GMP-specific phosphodiesterase class I)
MDIVHLRGYLRGFCELLEEPVCIGRKRFHMTVRIGVAKYPDNGGSAEELQRNADIALINAKKPGNNVCQFFCKVLLDNVERKTRLENDLMSAISNNELFVLYQPQYSCGSSRLRGFEALIRWEHPKLGVISPIEFIPIAEEAGMINDIGKWIIETVLGTFRKLRDIAKVSTIVSIDISVTQMLEPSFISMVSETLKKTGFESRYLEFEMAESALDSKSEYVIRVMKQLKGLDIGLALDDFGATHASLNYLQMLPINILKIGKTLVDKIAPSHQLTGAMISLSHMLGFEVVAQGVELQQQMDDLIEQRCDYIQGDLLSKPIDEGQIVRIYSERGHTS